MKNFPDRIALVGMRGSGKTTLGRLIAEKLALQLIDCDKVLESRMGMTILEMFSQFGESGFREKEAKCLADLVQGERWIMACGGGVVLGETNRSLLRERSFVIWLDAPPETLAERVSKDPWSATGRPPLDQSNIKISTIETNKFKTENRSFENVRQELKQVYSTRQELYKNTSHLRFSTSTGSPEEWWTRLQQEFDNFQTIQRGS